MTPAICITVSAITSQSSIVSLRSFSPIEILEDLMATALNLGDLGVRGVLGVFGDFDFVFLPEPVAGEATFDLSLSESED